MAELIPAILPKDYHDLEEKMNLVAGRVPLVHVDMTDGTLSPSGNWPFIEAGDEMPAFEELAFEVHIMSKDPEQYIEEWKKLGAERIIVHHESNFLRPDSSLEIECGLAVNFDTPIEDVLPRIVDFDFVHLMSIKEIGAQGHGFEEGIFERIAAIRDEYPDTIISVDGGLNAENVDRLIGAGVNRLVVGSAIYHASDPHEAIDELLEIAEGHELFN